MPDNHNHNEKPSNPPRITPAIPSRPGRVVSLAGVLERITEQFIAEHGDDPATFRHLKTDTERRAMIRDIAEYIFSVESLQLDSPQRAQIIRRAYDEIFGYGVLDDLFADETITTISIDGSEKIAVRHGIGQELTPIPPIFDDTPHLRRIIKRLLNDANAELRDETPIMEFGLRTQNRLLCVNLIAPPITPQLTLDIRLHPAQPLTLQNLIDTHFIPQPLDAVLVALMQSPHGFIIIGDTESGKTTLLNALINHAPPTHLITVERAGEFTLPDTIQSLTVKWAYGDTQGITFGQQILNALQQNPATLILDEVRADEPEALHPLLTQETAPRMIWSFRGGAVPKRIQSALGQVARLANPAQPEATVNTLYKRLPFIIILRRRQGQAQIRTIAEWQSDSNGYINLMTLASVQDGQIHLAGIPPRHQLALPSDFWQS